MPSVGRGIGPLTGLKLILLPAGLAAEAGFVNGIENFFSDFGKEPSATVLAPAPRNSRKFRRLRAILSVIYAGAAASS
jgi:hypothetical protein